MNEIMTEPAANRPATKVQSIEQLAPSGPELDEAAIRATLNAAEANNIDPQSITLDDFAQGQVSTPPAKAETPKPVEVPAKFLKPDGVVDVDKIQASTRQLDDAIQNREPVPQKTVDDYLREYQEKEKLFRSQTVPKQQPVEQAPIPAFQPAPASNEHQNFEDIVRRDYQTDPLGTTARLLDLMIQKKFAPLEEKEKIASTRENLQRLAEKDSRILREDVYAAVNKKLAEDPDLWKLKNPHKAAWLEVKEEMRLGEPTPMAQAQPSRPLSPVLGGGTPPSAPSTSNPSQPVALANLDALDLRDKKQEALGDEAIRRALMGQRG